MTDKMRDAFEAKFPNHAGFIFDDDTYVLPSGPTDSSLAIYCLEYRSAWRAWQAAQSVPVIGEVVAWAVPNSRPTELSPFMQVMLQIPSAAQYPELLVPLIVQPTTSITTAELERLRKDAERYAVVRDSTYCDVYMHEIYLTDDDLDAAIDAAIAAEGESNG